MKEKWQLEMLMRRHRRLMTNHLLPGTAILVLVAIMGCSPGDDSTSSEGARVNTGTGGTDRGGTAETAEGNERDQSVRDTAGRASSNASYSLVESATATIMATSAGNAEGTVMFSAVGDGRGMRVNVELSGLVPGLHGLHVHAVGDCSAADASSAGGHFNPDDAPHGSPESAEQHLGDLGNVEADSDGRVSTELRVRGLAFSGPASVLQKAVIVHRKEDDFTSQPGGDSGDPAGCGVIRIDRQVLTE